MKITPYYSGREAYNLVADDGSEYVYVPWEFLNKGFVQDGLQWYDPDFIRPDLLDNAKSIELPEDSNFSSQAKSLYKTPNKGFVWTKDDFAKINSDDFTFYNYPISNEFPAIEGLTQAEGKYTYKTGTKPGTDVSYLKGLDQNGQTVFTSWTKGKKSSWLGGIVGDWFDDLTAATGIQDLAGDVNDFFQTDLGKAVKFAALVASLGASSGADVAAEEAAKQAAADEASKQAAESAIDYYAGNYAGTEAASFLSPEQIAKYANIATPVTAEAITSEISNTQQTPIINQSPEPVVTPQPTPESVVTPESQIDYTAGNYSGTEAASFLTPDEIAFYGPITASEMASAKAASASTGWTFKQALDAVRAGLLVNAITGDPLGLSGTPSGNVGGGSTGFDIVPVPKDWKSPTYTNSPVTNVTFEDLFPGVSLQGTQWAGLQNAQPNMTFNDIFASGLQSTPMGTPVNIADIVGNIVGQSTKS